MGYVFPTVTDFKNYFVRDFPYGDDSTEDVLDSDIGKAQSEAQFNFSSALASDQNQFSLLFNYLTAHFLVMDLRASSQGISGRGQWLENAKSVGNVSQSFSIPDRILNNPELSYYTQTNYGMKYLMLILPRLTGQIFTVCGVTKP